MFSEHLSDGSLFQSTGIKSVPAINLVRLLRAGEHCLARIDYDHVIAHIHKGGPLRVALARQNGGNFRSKMTDGFAAGINHMPLSILRQTLTAGKVSRHR